MGSQHGGAAYVPKCKHGIYAWGPCDECRAERAREWEEEQARVDERVRPYHDMIANRRRWFDGCAFCPHDALVIRTKHEGNCPYLWAMFDAAKRFAVYLIRTEDAVSADRLDDAPCSTRAEGK